MPRPIKVIAYSGASAEQEPRAIVIDGQRLEVLGVSDRWLGPNARYTKVRAEDGHIYLLRLDLKDLQWTLVQVWHQAS